MTSENFESEEKMFTCLEEMTMKYIMAAFHNQSLIKQYTELMKIVKKHCKQGITLERLNNETHRLYILMYHAIYPNVDCYNCGCTEADLLIDAVHRAIDPEWASRGVSGVSITRLILYYLTTDSKAIEKYSFTHFYASEEEIRECMIDACIMAPPKAFAAFVNEKISSIVPACCNCGKTNKLVRCSSCKKQFCNRECQRDHHKVRGCKL